VETAALEEFQAYNQNIVFEFINPLENEDTSMDNIKRVVPKGLTPVNITVDDKGNNLRPWSLPWAT
jgi:hypothetical protein